MSTLPHYWKMDNPQSNVANLGAGKEVAFHKSGSMIAIASGTSPRIYAFKWNVIDGFGTAPTGTRFNAPSTILPSTGNSCDFHPSGSYIAATHVSNPGITVYPWSTITGFRDKFPNPSTLPASTAQHSRWHPNGSYVAVGHASSPFVSVYPWSPSGFGAKFPNPSTLPGTSGLKVAWHPSGSYIAIGTSTSPFVQVYPWGPSGFGAKFPNPSTLLTAAVICMDWHPSGSVLLAGNSTSPFIYAYPWSPSGFGARYPNPTTLVQRVNGLCFNEAGTELILSLNAAPFVTMYEWSGGSAGYGKNLPYSYHAPLNAGASVSTFKNIAVAIAHGGSSENPTFFIYSKLNIGNRGILKGGKL